MRTFQILWWAAAVASFIAIVMIGNSIARDVNQTSGTDYNGIWSLRGNKIWKEHEQLFPASRKRAALVAALVVAFGLFLATAFLAH